MVEAPRGLVPLFEPASIAVVGASNVEGKVGFSVVRNLRASGFEGPIYPVNLKEAEVQGLTAYPSLMDLPEDVDMVVVCVPFQFVPAVMEQAGRKGARTAVIITAGFSETGKEGKELELRIAETARRYGMRMLGPNCLGVVNTHHHMNATFATRTPRAGELAMISQSGAVCVAVLDWAEMNRVGFSKFISVGNKLDIEESHLMDYLKDDPATGLVMMYIEGIRSGPEFIEAARKASRTKAVLAMKAGRTAAGAKAASSHTGAIAGSDAVFDAAFRKAGIMRVRELTEFYDFAKAFTQLPLPRGGRVAIVSNAGGFAVVATDSVGDQPELSMASFTRPTLELFQRSLPAESNIYNPVDVLGDAKLDRYQMAIEAALADDNVDAVLVIVAPVGTTMVGTIAQYVAGLGEGLRKPICMCLMGGADMQEGFRIMRESRVPNFDSPERAVRVLAGLARSARNKSAPPPSQPVRVKGDRSVTRAAFRRVLGEGRLQMSEDEGYEVLKAYGIPVAPMRLATSADDAAAAARELGFPVVLKVASADIAHKTDAGGIIVGLASADAVRDNYRYMMSTVAERMPRARIDGAVVQKMVKGREVIVGVTRDPTFGPVVTFGLGGIFVEVLKDVQQRIAPLSREDIKGMITGIRSFPILAGARGKRPADVAAVEDIIARATQIALDFPEVQELEVNPLLVCDEGEGAWAVDSLITLKGASK
jgi:acetyl coenzyme A synthetase (ADP forming)-like protein